MTKTKSTPIKANPPAMRVSDLTPNPRNPRKITDDKLAMLRREMEEFGDLSGIVLNTTSGHLVGGHQRVKNFDPAWEVRKTSCTDKTGTVAKGIIITPYGEWTYREVSWSANKEYLANIAANKQLAEFDMYEVNKIFQEFKGSDLNLTLSGFEMDEIEGLFEKYNKEIKLEKTTKKRLEKPFIKTYVLIEIRPEILHMIENELKTIEQKGGIIEIGSN